MHAKFLQSCLILCDPIDCSPLGFSVPMDRKKTYSSLGKNTGVGCHFLLQGLFLTQRLNPCLLHWQADSLPLRHRGLTSFFFPGGSDGNLGSGNLSKPIKQF